MCGEAPDSCTAELLQGLCNQLPQLSTVIHIVGQLMIRQLQMVNLLLRLAGTLLELSWMLLGGVVPSRAVLGCAGLLLSAPWVVLMWLGMLRLLLMQPCHRGWAGLLWGCTEAAGRRGTIQHFTQCYDSRSRLALPACIWTPLGSQSLLVGRVGGLCQLAWYLVSKQMQHFMDNIR